MPEPIVTLLEHDPELAETLEPDRARVAARHVRARTHRLHPGDWADEQWPAEVRDGLGLLVVDGLLLRRVSLNGRSGAELVGRGDLLRPWQREEDALASVARSSGWRILQPGRVAVLDVDFIKRLAPFPEVQGQLMSRAMRRAFNLGVIMAIVHEPRVKTRLLTLLWHMADRWGKVRQDGVLVPLKLTHATLAELLAARRPTVSASLGTLQRDGAISTAPDGWVLHGTPPGEQAVAFAVSRTPRSSFSSP